MRAALKFETLTVSSFNLNRLYFLKTIDFKCDNHTDWLRDTYSPVTGH